MGTGRVKNLVRAWASLAGTWWTRIMGATHRFTKAPLHAEDEAAPLDEAKVQARPPGLAIGCTDVRRTWETTGSGMGVMEEGVASVWKGLNFPEGACRGASSSWSAR